MTNTPVNTNQVTIDPVLNKEILIGYCDRGAYKIPRYQRWFDEWYKKQEPEVYYTGKLQAGFLASLSITIISASWCGSCRTEVARFYKIFDGLNINYNKVTVIYVNKQKQAPGIDISALRIGRVPTFIFYKNSTEIARITEQPKDTLEAELFRVQENNK
ncbi:MAG: thioredoxin family protein [Bacteroidota bacterium]